VQKLTPSVTPAAPSHCSNLWFITPSPQIATGVGVGVGVFVGVFVGVLVGVNVGVLVGVLVGVVVGVGVLVKVGVGVCLGVDVTVGDISGSHLPLSDDGLKGTHTRPAQHFLPLALTSHSACSCLQ
jgi:hypothetical protein